MALVGQYLLYASIVGWVLYVAWVFVKAYRSV
jgi:hypothetical protein